MDLDWKSDTEFYVGDLRFKCLMGDYYSEKTDAEHLVLLKPRHMVEHGLALYREHNVKRAFEFGIFQGGSVMLMTEALGLERMVALDFSQPIEPLDKMIVDRGLSDRVKLHYGISQNHREPMEAAIRESFAPGELDLIIDDCSHLYQPTKNSFEVAFPYLKPGGLYVIEDWGWAHWPGPWQKEDHHWRGHLAMSNLIFELVMTTASVPDFFGKMTIYGHMVIIEKSPKAQVGKAFSLDALVKARGKTLDKI